VKFRYNRNPIIGDKFSSRHGQKGTLSLLYPDVDMPFCLNSGIRPDIIINPHAFPSRMTIGMIVESLASKAGAQSGTFTDSTPFKHAGKHSGAGQDFEAALVQHGFARHGNERMVSGVMGTEMECDIFIGCVYYQRLRHMVSKCVFVCGWVAGCVCRMVCVCVCVCVALCMCMCVCCVWCTTSASIIW
jgi:DNA-directed RNA polymerase I subunit RPA2